MENKEILNEEVSRMRSLFDYKRGEVISEQSVTTGFNTYTPPQQQAKQAQQVQQAQKTASDAKSAQMPASCKNAITYEDLSTKVEGVANAIKKMDAAFLRMGYGKERAMEIYNVIKGLQGKNVYDEVTGECVNALGKFKGIFERKSSGWFQGGFDFQEKAQELITGYYKDDDEVIRYLDAASKILEGTLTVKDDKSQTTATTKKPAQQYTIPEELKKPVGKLTGVQAFQNWLDDNYPNYWNKKYPKLESKPERGWGKYGPSTDKAWNTLDIKNKYLGELGRGLVLQKYGKTETAYQKPSDSEITGLKGGDTNVAAEYRPPNIGSANNYGVNPNDIQAPVG